jgi:predicted  nucleic acid-binding Zn-ribbon protein
MPHQCVRCNAKYSDGDQVILAGCTCGSRLFFYIRKEKLAEAEKVTHNFTQEEKKSIEEDVFDIIGTKVEEEKPVVLDFEAVRVVGPGKFELDLVHLFKEGDPLVYKLDEGKYVIDINGTFQKRNKNLKK